MYKEFLSECQGEVEEGDGKCPSWHGSIRPTAKGSGEADTTSENSVNSEALRIITEGIAFILSMFLFHHL